MELKEILLNPDTIKHVCCLCFKKAEECIGLYDEIEIHDEKFNYDSSLSRIMKNLFPSHELVLSQMCDTCCTLILKVFSLLQRNILKNDFLHYLVSKIDQKIDEVECELYFNSNIKNCKLNFNVSSNEIISSLPKTEDQQCMKCPMKFRSKVLLKEHFQLAHKNTNDAVICDVCGKTFGKNSSLVAHLHCHKEKQCPYCFKTLKSHSHLKIHLRDHTSQPKTKRNVKSYNCTHCDYHSLNKCSLEAHINKVHLGIKPFICEVCQKGFYKKDNLVQHLVTHNKNKEKICYICGDTFGVEKTLQEHLKIHSGIKPYKCDICNIGFITSGRRNEHKKRKHMEKKETCVVCSKKFSLKKDLNTHMKNVHGAETESHVMKVGQDSDKSGYEEIKVINCKK